MFVSPAEPTRVQFGLDDAIISTTTTEQPLSQYVPIIDNEIPPFIPPISQDEVEEILDSVSLDENQIFDSRLNFLGKYLQNIVPFEVYLIVPHLNCFCYF